MELGLPSANSWGTDINLAAVAVPPPRVARAAGLPKRQAWLRAYRWPLAGTVISGSLLVVAVIFLALPRRSSEVSTTSGDPAVPAESDSRRAPLSHPPPPTVPANSPAPSPASNPPTPTNSSPPSNPPAAAEPRSNPPSNGEKSPPVSSEPPSTTAAADSSTSQLQRRSPGAAAPPPAGKSRAPGLQGISRRYDDLECSRLQQQLGLRIPVGAALLEVDGETLPVAGIEELQQSSAPYLLLPPGQHAVRFQRGERPVAAEITASAAETYADMRRFFNLAGPVRLNELISRGGRAMDVHHAPFLLNFLGASYAERKEWKAAERKFRRALRVNPTFSPAHLNLAYVLHQSGAKEEAVRELRLADAFNVGNVYGLAPALAALRQEFGLEFHDAQVVELRFSQYVSTQPLSEEDRRVAALMQGFSKYAVRDEDRGKILNNLAVHFVDRGNIDVALDWFQQSLDALRYAGPERFALARRVFQHMESACRQAGYVEADEYRSMQEDVVP